MRRILHKSAITSHDQNIGPVTKIEGKFKKYQNYNLVKSNMDILDPLEVSETVEVESKGMLNEINEIHIKPQAMDSDDCDDDGNVDHLSPQTLLETPDHEVQYSLRSPEGNNVVTYRVVQVDDSSVQGVPQIVSAESPGYGNTSSAVLTSNLNGQLYVIGNANEMFTANGGCGRTIAPRSSVMDGGSGVVCNLKKRDDRRRATHNEVERRRRDKINNWITKLASIIPDTTSGEIRANGLYDGQSKGGILAKACDYILDLRDINERYEALSEKYEALVNTAEVLKIKNSTIERENKELKATLKKHGILYVPKEFSS
ncbi:unnamed protein product [Phaedon cochleariae]|uniref:BHLH domain-containing protein n=1 Tax=Phaedon cochleariae TaxID=80249 RepID=A0A9P0DN98_PHACE|nr:unnamed protein product [Phaedon cochleariae]